MTPRASDCPVCKLAPCACAYIATLRPDGSNQALRMLLSRNTGHRATIGLVAHVHGAGLLAPRRGGVHGPHEWPLTDPAQPWPASAPHPAALAGCPPP